MSQKERSPFALRLQRLRKQRHMTQADVAKVLNLHRTSYTNYETDGSHPDPATLRILAELFEVTVDYLLGKDGEDIDLLQDNVTVVALSPEEKELVTSFRRLTESQKQLILQNERELLKSKHEED